ncbi:MAG TPA: thiamine diphosphokinase [Anaerolineales bacterium]|nr:thiamine diphosphokinase [Anaerolineales bacterium]
MQRIIIFANGELPDLHKARLLLRTDDYIICADGGTRHALALDRQPNLLVGDMDSISKERWQELQTNGVNIELHPPDKNETDLELALERALELDPKEILIVGALGGRLDQTIANLAILSDTRQMQISIRLDDGVEEVFFCRDQAQIHGRSGDIVSLIPWGGDVSGIQTQGLRWPLNRETLFPEKTRGISNEMLGDVASVSVELGLLLVIHRRKS